MLKQDSARWKRQITSKLTLLCTLCSQYGRSLHFQWPTFRDVATLREWQLKLVKLYWNCTTTGHLKNRNYIFQGISMLNKAWCVDIALRWRSVFWLFSTIWLARKNRRRGTSQTEILIQKSSLKRWLWGEIAGYQPHWADCLMKRLLCVEQDIKLIHPNQVKWVQPNQVVKRGVSDEMRPSLFPDSTLFSQTQW